MLLSYELLKIEESTFQVGDRLYGCYLSQDFAWLCKLSGMRLVSAAELATGPHTAK